MAVEEQRGLAEGGEALEQPWGARLALLQKVEQLAGSRVIVYLLFALFYALPAIHLARRKLLWDDEFFTLYLSSTSSWHELLRALATGADQHPPTFYYLTHVAFKLLGTSHLVLRLPAIVGFGLMCVCLYEIVRFLATPLWGVVALLFPQGTNLYYYVTEARGYALVCGFMALAVLAWLKVTSGPRRRLWLGVLAMALIAAVACHYYAVVAAACLALGELVRTRTRRHVDVPVWIAVACALIPIATFVKTIQSARGYSTHFWAVPIWMDSIRFFQSELDITIASVGGAVALLVFLKNTAGWSVLHSRLRQGRLWMPWEVTTITALALLPFVVMVLAKFVTHAFADRYAIAAVIGVATLLACTLYRLDPDPQAAVVAIAACVMMYVYQFHTSSNIIDQTRGKTAAEIRRLAQLHGQNVAVMDVTVFHRVSFYAPRSIASEVAYLSDPRESIRYLGHDTIDRGLLELRPWFPLEVVPAGTFLRENPRFYAFGSVYGWNWLTFDLPTWGDTQLLSQGGNSVLLFSVTNVRPNLLPVQEDAGSNEALINKVPKTGPSLCATWMGPKDCL